jgi:hypothetical protein
MGLFVHPLRAEFVLCPSLHVNGGLFDRGFVPPPLCRGPYLPKMLSVALAVPNQKIEPCQLSRASPREKKLFLHRNLSPIRPNEPHCHRKVIGWPCRSWPGGLPVRCGKALRSQKERPPPLQRNSPHWPCNGAHAHAFQALYRWPLNPRRWPAPSLAVASALLYWGLE